VADLSSNLQDTDSGYQVIDAPRVVAALRELSKAFVAGHPDRYGMRIPAEPYRDGDLVCGTAARLIERLLAGSQTETSREPEWTREVGWLVENGKSGDELRYRTMEQGLAVWTADNLKALRFARREDAEMFSQEDEDAWRIAEHIWTGPPVKTTEAAAHAARNKARGCDCGSDCDTHSVACSMFNQPPFNTPRSSEKSSCESSGKIPKEPQ
jgi:hypothetical protein